jgi:hypothetical protein
MRWTAGPDPTTNIPRAAKRNLPAREARDRQLACHARPPGALIFHSSRMHSSNLSPAAWAASIRTPACFCIAALPARESGAAAFTARAG